MTVEKELLAYLRDKHGERFVSRLKYYFDLHFGSCDIKNRSVLEIGAGCGYLSAFCIARGASRVVAIEPESNGSTKGVNDQFSNLVKSVELGNSIEYLPTNLEKFITSGRKGKFDYILMCNVINHMDEDAVTKIHLPNAENERKRYISIFKEINNLLTDTGILLFSDSGRYNFWNVFGLRFPACRTIDWDKHQDPDVWKTLLSKADFASITIKWLPLYCFRYLNKTVGRKLMAQCLNSYFLILASKQEKRKIA